MFLAAPSEVNSLPERSRRVATEHEPERRRFGRSEDFLNSFFRATGIRIDWTQGEHVWRTAGRAFQRYASRKKQGGGPRRILADFLIGAHAVEGGHCLLTLDNHLYRAAFPALALVRL